MIMHAYRYKVHSAIYSWNSSESSTLPASNVTEIVQQLLNDRNNQGVIPLNHDIFIDPAPGKPKSLAVIVSIVAPDGQNTTRFCSCPDGQLLNVKESGVECYF